jgi:DnaJ-domain-containing protein 1
MSTTEILVIAFGFFLGYWIVSKLFASKSSGNQKNSESTSKDRSATGHQQENSSEWFDVLKVSSNASIEEIRAAYKSLIRQYHPDRVEALGEELKILAEEKSKEINAAYEAGLRARGS